MESERLVLGLSDERPDEEGSTEPSHQARASIGLSAAQTHTYTFQYLGGVSSLKVFATGRHAQIFLEGREKERERNINVWLPFTWSPQGNWPAPRHKP